MGRVAEQYISSIYIYTLNYQKVMVSSVQTIISGDSEFWDPLVACRHPQTITIWHHGFEQQKYAKLAVSTGVGTPHMNQHGNTENDGILWILPHSLFGLYVQFLEKTNPAQEAMKLHQGTKIHRLSRDHLIGTEQVQSCICRDRQHKPQSQGDWHQNSMANCWQLHLEKSFGVRWCLFGKEGLVHPSLTLCVLKPREVSGECSTNQPVAKKDADGHKSCCYRIEFLPVLPVLQGVGFNLVLQKKPPKPSKNWLPSARDCNFEVSMCKPSRGL
jgi:hypothetical protein